MCNNRFISGMVMYTIKDDDLRKNVRNGIINKYGDNPLDQSTYEIKCAAEHIGNIVSTLKDICERAKNETKKDFVKDAPDNKNDFVAFYHATNSDYKEKRDKIQRIPIV